MKSYLFLKFDKLFVLIVCSYAFPIESCKMFLKVLFKIKMTKSICQKFHRYFMISCLKHADDTDRRFYL